MLVQVLETQGRQRFNQRGGDGRATRKQRRTNGDATAYQRGGNDEPMGGKDAETLLTGRPPLKPVRIPVDHFANALILA